MAKATNDWVGKEWTTGSKSTLTSFVGVAGGCCEGSCTTDTKVEIKDEEGKVVEVKKPEKRLPVRFTAPTHRSLKPEALKVLNQAGYTNEQIDKRQIFGFKNIDSGVVARKWRKAESGDIMDLLMDEVNAEMDRLFDEDMLAEAKDLNAQVRDAGGDVKKLQAIVDGFETTAG